MKKQLTKLLTAALLGIVTLVMVAPKTASAVGYQAVGYDYCNYQMALYYQSNNPAYPPDSAYNACIGFGYYCAYAQYYCKLADQQWRSYRYYGDAQQYYYYWLATYVANLYVGTPSTASWAWSYFRGLGDDEWNTQDAAATWISDYYVGYCNYYENFLDWSI